MILGLKHPDPDPDPDPAIFVIDLQDANIKLILCSGSMTFWSVDPDLRIHASRTNNSASDLGSGSCYFRH
jgi:hypothetical protein